MIVAAPNLNNNMIHSDNRIFMKPGSAQHSQDDKNKVFTDVFVPLPYKVKLNHVYVLYTHLIILFVRVKQTGEKKRKFCAAEAKFGLVELG